MTAAHLTRDRQDDNKRQNTETGQFFANKNSGKQTNRRRGTKGESNMFRETRLASSIGCGRLVDPSGALQSDSQGQKKRKPSTEFESQHMEIANATFSSSVLPPCCIRLIQIRPFHPFPFESHPPRKTDYTPGPALPFRTIPIHYLFVWRCRICAPPRIAVEGGATYVRVRDPERLRRKRSYMITHLEQQPALSPGSLTSILPSGARAPYAPEPDG